MTTPAIRAADVEGADRFLAETKSLTDGLPNWTDSHIHGWLTAAWPIIDAEGVIREGTRLAFSCKASDISYVSVSLLLRGSRIFAVDLVPGNQTKVNGPRAQFLGLPARVAGSHFHTWADNRDHALSAGIGDMPHRRPTPQLLTRLPHALTALCQGANIVLTPEQASFDVPPRGELPFQFGR